MKPYPLLFSPLEVNRLKLRNRIVMPAMHLNYTPGGQVSDQLLAFYAERARGGAGLIIFGGCVINDLAGGPIFISIKSDEDIAGLSRLADAAHDHGAAIGPQLYMAGGYAHSALIGQEAVSSSAHTSRFTRGPVRELSLEEIVATQDDFAAAARRAQEAGMDFVEILGSAGYLICQFLSPVINKRQDQYGGSLENRMRLGLETIAKVRAAVGPEFAVGIRIAGNDFVPGSHTNDEARLFAAACAQAGVDMINVTGGWHETKVPQITEETPRAGFTYLARGVRQAVNVPVAASNRINHPRLAEEVLARGDADLVCLGRPLLADPQYPAKAAAGRSQLIRRCVACNQGCFDRIPLMRPAGCMVNPRAGHEHEPPVQPADPAQKVVVVGGGPAGCEAALGAAKRGHRVTLLEAGPKLGGQPLWYAAAVEKPDFSTIAQYHRAALAEAGVEVRLGRAADAALVKSLGPQQVIVATGAQPIWPEIPGLDGPQVLGAWEVLKGRALPRGEVVVLGGGAVGLETALYIARQGALTPEQAYFLTLYQAETPEVIRELISRGSHRVTVVEMLPKLGKDIGRSTRWIVLGKVRLFNVYARTKSRVIAVEEGAVLIEGEEGQERLPADSVVVALGSRPENALARELAADGLKVTQIGDAAGGGTLLAAIEQGYQAGATI